MTMTLEFLLRIALACVCGAIIGIERTVRLKEAGIRTHTIVALGAALMMVVSKYGFTDIALYGGGFDASRIAASVVSGISFLGAGVFFVRGSAIRGLTTSAGIWTTAGIGMALGAGMYEVGLAATGLLILLQILLHRFVGGLDGMTITELSVIMPCSPLSISRIKTLLAEKRMEVHSCRVVRNSGNTITLYLTVKLEGAIQPEDLMVLLEKEADITEYTIG